MMGFWCSVLLLAMLSGHWDAEQALSHQRIDHIRKWLLRAFLACLAAGIALPWAQGAWKASIPVLLAAAPVFSLLFRSTMNWKRGLHQLYASPSNAYDRRALRAVRPAWAKGLVTRLFAYHEDLYWMKGGHADLLVPGRPLRVRRAAYRAWAHSAGALLVLMESLAALLLLCA
jgi:hypothetical protein